MKGTTLQAFIITATVAFVIGYWVAKWQGAAS